MPASPASPPTQLAGPTESAATAAHNGRWRPGSGPRAAARTCLPRSALAWLHWQPGCGPFPFSRRGSLSTRFFAHWATWAAALAAVLFAVPAGGPAPGADPVVLTQKLTLQMQPPAG